MEKEIKRYIKILLVYWIIVAIIPILGAKIIFFNDGSIFFLYIVLVPLILTFLPYMIAKPQGKKVKVGFVLYGLVVPLLILYSFVFLQLKNAFHMQIIG